MQHKKFRKIIFSILILFQIFALNFNLAFAQTPVFHPPGKASQLGEDIGSDIGNAMGPNLGNSMSESMATGMAETLEKRYNLNLTSIQDQGQNFNVMGNKMMGPQVMLAFNPSAPKPNETITATASPLYFGNSSATQYFTWYLKHKGCELGMPRGNTPEERKLYDFCNADDIGGITENDWKVEAARIVAGNGFNWEDAEYFSLNGDGATAPNGEDDRGDGYRAYMGGEEQKGTDSPGIGLDLTDETKTFICDLLTLVDADKKLYKDLWDKFGGACDGYNPPADNPTNEELMLACVKDEACMSTAITNSITTTQEWADGCRNSNSTAEACSDHTTIPAPDGTIGCPENVDAITMPNPEQECWDASADEETGYKEINTLASNCQNDTSNNDSYTCRITAALIKYHGLNYENLFDGACDDDGEKDCARSVTWNTYADNITACFNDESCPTTALTTALINNEAGQALLAQSCTDNPETCSTTAGNGGKGLAKMKALIEILTTLTDVTKDIIKNLPQYAKELEAIKKQLEDMPNLITDAVDKKNFEQVCKGKQSDAGIWGWVAEQFPALSPYIAILACWDDIWAEIQPIIDQIMSLLNKMDGSKAKCYIHDFSVGQDYELPDSQCKHQFATSIVNPVGNAHYGPAEEYFFRTNPQDTSTADNGNVDEANVAGRGQDKISWDYQAGDQIGVIVEGVFVMSSKYDDATQKVMWALPKSIFSGSGDCNLKVGSPLKEMIKGYEVLIPSAKYENSEMFTECLSANLIDPQAGGQSEKIDVALSYSPKNPVNDTSGAKGDTLKVQASILSGNVPDKSTANFTWTVSMSTDSEPNGASWCTIPEDTASKMFKQNAGKGLDVLTMQLKYKADENIFRCLETGRRISPAEAKMLKVSVKVLDNAYTGIFHEGSKSITIPIFSDDEQIEAWTVAVSENTTDPANVISTLALDTLRGACDPGDPCPVIKNDIIGVQVDNSLENYSWEIDGKPFTPVAGCGSACSGSEDKTFGFNTNTAFFPVTNNPGQRHIITMNAEKKDGEKVKLSKTFNVIEPTMKINIEGSSASGDEYQYVYQVELGQFTFPDGTVVPDMSPTDFNVTDGTTIKLTLQNYPPVSFDKIHNFSWKIGEAELVINKNNELFINEVPISSTLIVPEELATELTAAGLNNFSLELNPGDNTKSVSFTVGKKAGNIYPISASGTYTQTDSIKMALFRNWGIQMSSFYENEVGATMNLNVESPIKTSMNAPQKVLATIFSNFPSYLGFLIKIALNTLLILFAAWLILSFLPKKNEI